MAVASDTSWKWSIPLLPEKNRSVLKTPIYKETRTGSFSNYGETCYMNSQNV
jgi:hypothetical protein